GSSAACGRPARPSPSGPAAAPGARAAAPPRRGGRRGRTASGTRRHTRRGTAARRREAAAAPSPRPVLSHRSWRRNVRIPLISAPRTGGTLGVGPAEEGGGVDQQVGEREPDQTRRVEDPQHAASISMPLQGPRAAGQRCCEKECDPATTEQRQQHDRRRHRVHPGHTVMPAPLLAGGGVDAREGAETPEGLACCRRRVPPHERLGRQAGAGAVLGQPAHEDAVFGGAQVGEAAGPFPRRAPHHARRHERVAHRTARCRQPWRVVGVLGDRREARVGRHLVVAPDHVEIRIGGGRRGRAGQPLEPVGVDVDTGIRQSHPLRRRGPDADVATSPRRGRPRLYDPPIGMRPTGRRQARHRRIAGPAVDEDHGVGGPRLGLDHGREAGDPRLFVPHGDDEGDRAVRRRPHLRLTIRIRPTFKEVLRAAGLYKLAPLFVGASVVGAFLEVLTLGLIAQAAVAITSHTDKLHLTGPLSVLNATSPTELIVIGLVLLALRIPMYIVIAEVPARVSARVQEVLRGRLFHAYLHAPWLEQMVVRDGHLLEMASTQTQQAAQAVVMAMLTVCWAVSLLVLVAGAITFSPLAALAVLAALCILFFAARPLAGAVARSAEAHAASSQEFMVDPTEATTLVGDVRTYGVMSAEEERVRRSLTGIRGPWERVQRAHGLVPGAYQTAATAFMLAGLAVVSASGTAGSLGNLGAVVLILFRALSA